jgi:FtsH-binding integral membrane protein
MSVCDHYYGKVFAHLAGGMGITALSAEYSNLGSKLVPGSPITSAFVLLGISLALIFGMNYAAPGGILIYILFAAFAFALGQTIKPMVRRVEQNHQLVHILTLTTGLFVGMMAIGFYDNQHILGFGPYLLVALLGLIVAEVVWFLVSTPEQYKQSQSYSALFGIILFSFFTVYHTQVIKKRAQMCRAEVNRGNPPNYPVYSLLFLLDYANLFTDISRS